MKRATVGTKQTFAHCKLYRDEIEDIIELLTVQGVPPTVQSDGYEIESEDDIFEYLGKEGRATLEISSPNIPSEKWREGSFNSSTWPSSVVLRTTKWNGEVTVSTNGDSNITLALLERVSSIVRQNASGYWFTESNIFAALGFGAFSGSLVWFAIPRLRPIGYILLASGAAVSVLRWFTRPSVRTRYYGIRRHEQRSFWDRKKDDLIEKALMVLLSAVVGWSVGRYLTPRQDTCPTSTQTQQSHAEK